MVTYDNEEKEKEKVGSTLKEWHNNGAILYENSGDEYFEERSCKGWNFLSIGLWQWSWILWWEIFRMAWKDTL